MPYPHALPSSAAAQFHQARRRARLLTLWRKAITAAPILAYVAGAALALFTLKSGPWWALVAVFFAGVATTVMAVDIVFRRRHPPRVVGVHGMFVLLRRAGEPDTQAPLPPNLKERLHGRL